MIPCPTLRSPPGSRHGRLFVAKARQTWHWRLPRKQLRRTLSLPILQIHYPGGSTTTPSLLAPAVSGRATRSAQSPSPYDHEQPTCDSCARVTYYASCRVCKIALCHVCRGKGRKCMCYYNYDDSDSADESAKWIEGTCQTELEQLGGAAINP